MKPRISTIFQIGAEPDIDSRCTASPRRLPGYCVLLSVKYFYNNEENACIPMARGHCNGDEDLFVTEDECIAKCYIKAE